MKNKKDSDYELLYLISENNEDAKKLFYEKYKPIIEMKVKKYISYVESRGYDYNDLVQEGMIGLSRAITDYKTQKDVQFNTFANLCIDRQLYTFIRNIDRDKHKILNDSVSLDSTINSIGKPLTEILDDKNVDPESSFIEMEEKQELFKKITNLLSKQETDVFYLRIQGFTYKEIAALLNITPKAVDGCISKIKSKISNKLDEDGIK